LPSESNILFDVTPFESLIHRVFWNHSDVVVLIQNHGKQHGVENPS
jgi:hypothetical protein